MPLYDYSERSHAAGAKCIRVTGHSKSQRYFPQTRNGRLEARAYNAKLERESRQHKRARQRKAEVWRKRDYDTDCGVAGITMTIEGPRGASGRWYAYLMLQVLDCDGALLSRKLRVKHDTLAPRFKELLQSLKEAKGIKRIPKHWATTSPPTIKRYQKLRRQMRRDGKMVDTDYLD